MASSKSPKNEDIAYAADCLGRSFAEEVVRRVGQQLYIELAASLVRLQLDDPKNVHAHRTYKEVFKHLSIQDAITAETVRWCAAAGVDVRFFTNAGKPDSVSVSNGSAVGAGKTLVDAVESFRKAAKRRRARAKRSAR